MSKDNKWVIKAGSSLVSGKDEGINTKFISNLVSQVDFLKKNKPVSYTHLTLPTKA